MSWLVDVIRGPLFAISFSILIYEGTVIHSKIEIMGKKPGQNNYLLLNLF